MKDKPTQESRDHSHLEYLIGFRKKIEEMSSCHIVTYPLLQVGGYGTVSFDIEEGSFIHSLEAADDFSGAFDLVKEALLKGVDFDIKMKKKQLGELNEIK